MKRQYVEKANLPDTPGLYFFKKGKNTLYIGRATSLKNRVKSYFDNDLIHTRGSLLVDMVFHADKLEYQETDSVLEAILLEAELIKQHQPKYNTDEKDDKSFNCIGITDEDFPRVLVIRKREINFDLLKTNDYQLKTVFGPYPHGGLLKEALKIIRRIFPYRDEKCMPNQGRPCFNRQIGLCPGVCMGEISKIEYRKIVKNIELLLHGKKSLLIRKLEREMKVLAKAQEFEKAGEIKKTIFALQHIQDVSLLKREAKPGNGDISENSFRIEAYDVAHISGTHSVGVMTVFDHEGSQKSQYRKFKLRGNFGNHDIAGLTEILERRLKHSEWPFPNLIVVDGAKPQKNATEKILEKNNLSIPVVAVVKDDRHKARAILGDTPLAPKYQSVILQANLEAHRFAITYHRKLRSKLF
jgi:excinuclease ABC subunit C